MRVETERIAEVIRSNKEKAVRSGSYKRDAWIFVFLFVLNKVLNKEGIRYRN
jgi:hypothetical protein